MGWGGGHVTAKKQSCTCCQAGKGFIASDHQCTPVAAYPLAFESTRFDRCLAHVPEAREAPGSLPLAVFSPPPRRALHNHSYIHSLLYKPRYTLFTHA